MKLAQFKRNESAEQRLGVLVGAGANLLGYSVQSLYLPNWFVRRRGVVVGITTRLASSGSGRPRTRSIAQSSRWRPAKSREAMPTSSAARFLLRT